MATLWIREYSGVGAARPADTAYDTVVPGGVPVVQEPGTDQTPLSYTASTQSAAFATGTVYIAIISNSAFHYCVGASPVATTSMIYVPAGTLWCIGVTAAHKIAAVTAA